MIDFSKQYTLHHVLLSIPIFLITVFIVATWHVWWLGVWAVALYWGGRELAQSFRPSNMKKLNWTWTNTRNFGVPVGVAAVVAAACQFFLT